MAFPLYAFSDLGSSPPIEHKLHAEIVAAGPYTTNFLYVVADYAAATVLVVFDALPSMGNQATIDAVIAAHDGVAVPLPFAAFLLTKTFVASGAGADDVVIYEANAPYAFRIINSYVYVSTPIGAATLQLRDALGGGGSALSDSWLATLVGMKIDVDLPTSIPTIAMGGTLALRRSSGDVEGEVVMVIERVG